MVFSSILFLFTFLPIVLISYRFIDRKYRNKLLYFSSIFFYAWGAPEFVFVLFFVTFLDFHLVALMEKQASDLRRKFLLSASLFLNLGLLFYFKYCNFFIENINYALKGFNISNITLLNVVLPIGISFYTFETVTYVVDVYRKIHKPLKSFMDYQLYIFFFPKLIAGPIVRYHEIADQIAFRKESVPMFLAGFKRFGIGLSKKVLLANAIAAIIVNVVPNSSEKMNTADAWMSSLAYTFQLYFDFSGYSDMAIGLALMFGFVLPENFNNPYCSRSITQFWKRWHMTLGAWMKNYLYIPLGGNRVTAQYRHFLNLWIVFLVSGFWHGASWNFVLWGAFHGLFIVLEKTWYGKLLAKLGHFPAVILTFLLANFGWVFFKLSSLKEAVLVVKKMLIFDFNGGFRFDAELYSILAVCIFFSFIWLWTPFARFQIWFYKIEHKMLSQILLTALVAILVTLSTTYLASSDFNPFIYFRF